MLAETLKEYRTNLEQPETLTHNSLFRLTVLRIIHGRRLNFETI